ncbi:MAG: 23S rRNA (uracil(1939)-C(5))-methyltransferase RlmD [Acholeplasma sp.]|nr:23S rRNA (uracil(1939)-C(5))-methyltransferase RlmD [Acholeplasma sp.]
MKDIIVTTYDLDYQAQGIGRIEDKVTFVKGMFKDETGIVEIIKEKKNYTIARLKTLIERSHDRVSDDTFDYAPLYGLSLEAECLWQQKITQETIRKIANLHVNVGQTVTDHNKLNYRNKITLHTKIIEGVLKIGVYKEQSRSLIEIDSHELAHPIINQTIKHVAQLFKEKSFRFDFLKHITIRTNETMIMLVLSVKKTAASIETFIQTLKPYADSIYLNHAIEDYEILSQDSQHIYGLEFLPIQFSSLTLSLGPTGFFQVNTNVALLMYEHIKNSIKGNVLIDAYAGMSSIGQFVSDKVKVLSIESNNDSVIQARASLLTNNINNVTIVHGNVENEIQKYINQADSIVFDPPRSGLAEPILDLLLETPVKQIIYVSCDLKTLSRDLSRLSQTYIVESVTPFRMFPSTLHVESIVLLSLKTA